MERPWTVQAMVLGVLALTAVSAPAQPFARGVKHSPYFQSLWARRPLFQQHFRLAVIQVTGAPTDRRHGQALPVRIVSILSEPVGEAPEPQAVEAFYPAGSRRSDAGLPAPGEQHYLGILYRRGSDEWVLASGMFSGRPLPEGAWDGGLPIDGPDAPLARAIRELMFDAPSPAAPGDLFDRTLHYLDSDDAAARDFAAHVASVNGMALRGAPADAENRDRFARRILACDDPAIRALLTQAYAASAADLLPDDPQLVEHLLAQADPQGATALGVALGQAHRRAADLLPTLRSHLAGPRTPPHRRQQALRALTVWGPEALLAQPELEALALGEGPPDVPQDQRITALAVLLANDASGSAELVVRTLAPLPSAAAMEYAVRQDMYRVVPLVIEAARAERVRWTASHAAALSLLTGRTWQDQTLAPWDRWWRQVERDGLGEAMLANGFMEPAAEARAQALLNDLRSPQFQRRQQARDALQAMGTVLPQAVRDAAHDPDPEVARSVAAVVAQADAELQPLRERLRRAAELERLGAPLPGDGPQREPVGATVQIRAQVIVAPR